MSIPNIKDTASNQSTHFTAIVLMITGSVLASMIGLLIRSMDSATPSQINIYRSVFFCAAIFAAFVFTHRTNTLKKVKALRWPVFWAALVLGAVGLLVPFALTQTTVANNSFALGTVPFITMILARIFLGEKISPTTLVMIVAAIIGIGFLVFDGIGSGNIVGDGLAILIAFGLAVFAVIVRANNHIEMVPCLFLAGMLVLAGSLATNRSGLSITLHDLVLCFIWGAILSALAHWAIIWASRYLKAAELTLFALLELALAPFWVWIFFSETPQPAALIGGAIVISSILVKIASDLRQSKPH